MAEKYLMTKSSEDTSALFGAFDSNIRLIEGAFGVRVSNRRGGADKEGDEIVLLTFADDEGKKVYRHTASHILAQAVKRLYPETKLTIGPAVDNGFYYDFDSEISFTQDILKALESEMKKIMRENLRIERFELPREEAIALMTEKNEPYKVQLIEELPDDAVISFYRQGEFVDLCAGPHLFSTAVVRAVKLTQSLGREMLRRWFMSLRGAIFIKW